MFAEAGGAEFEGNGPQAMEPSRHHAAEMAEPMSAPVIWLERPAADGPANDGTPADPYDVINFLLKKVEDQHGRIAEHEGFIELLTGEIDQLKGQLEASSMEIERQLADYEVLMQNALATEQALDQLRNRATAKPTIALPFHTEQRLAKLGYDGKLVPETV